MIIETRMTQGHLRVLSRMRSEEENGQIEKAVEVVNYARELLTYNPQVVRKIAGEGEGFLRLTDQIGNRMERFFAEQKSFIALTPRGLAHVVQTERGSTALFHFTPTSIRYIGLDRLHGLLLQIGEEGVDNAVRPLL